jgi:hypothetical protein
MATKRYRDVFTDDMFMVPQAPATHAASMNYGSEVAILVGSMFAASGIDRLKIAEEMSRLSGREVSKYMLDAWTSESRDAYNIPFYLVPAAETACRSHALSSWLAERRGARLAIGRDALNTEFGKLQSLSDDIKKRMQELQKMMRDA